jgi:hypothetical protein
MTPGDHVPRTLLAILVLAIAVFLGVVIWLLLRAAPGARPADLTPTPVIVIVDPTRPVAAPPTAAPPPTMPTPERLLLTPVVVPAPTRTPTPSPVPPIPTETPVRTPVQKG